MLQALSGLIIASVRRQSRCTAHVDHLILRSNSKPAETVGTRLPQVIKYADNILKTFANAMSILFTVRPLLQHHLFNCCIELDF